MLKRIITAAVALLLLIPVLYFAWSPVFPAAISLLCAVACYEMLKCVGLVKNYALSVPVIAFGAGLPEAARYLPVSVIPLLFLLFCYIVAYSVISYKKAPIDKIGMAYFELFSIICGFTLLVTVRDRLPLLYLLIFVAAWCTDTFAYFTGYFFGKKKLCPDISPKKTVAGAIGGIAGAVIGSVVLCLILDKFCGTDINIFAVAAAAVPLSVMGQIGDLSASLAKRHFGVKDYGNIFPGHGGVLDRFDSIIPVTVMIYIISCIPGILS